MAHAALSPENQQLREEQTIRESEVFKGKDIDSITMYEENETRLYRVEADCTYLFIINYPFDWWGALFGMVGPKQFKVKMVGEPNCIQTSASEPKQAALEKILLEAISKIYNVPIGTIGNDMTLYHISSDPKKLSMDFRILALRARIEERLACRIETDLFAKIRTVRDLIKTVNLLCSD